MRRQRKFVPRYGAFHHVNCGKKFTIASDQEREVQNVLVREGATK